MRLVRLDMRLVRLITLALTYVISTVLTVPTVHAWEATFLDPHQHTDGKKPVTFDLYIDATDLPAYVTGYGSQPGVIDHHAVRTGRQGRWGTPINTCNGWHDCWDIEFRVWTIGVERGKKVIIPNALVLRPNEHTPTEGVYSFGVVFGPQCLVNECPPVEIIVELVPSEAMLPVCDHFRHTHADHTHLSRHVLRITETEPHSHRHTRGCR